MYRKVFVSGSLVELQGAGDFRHPMEHSERGGQDCMDTGQLMPLVALPGRVLRCGLFLVNFMSENLWEP